MTLLRTALLLAERNGELSIASCFPLKDALKTAGAPHAGDKLTLPARGPAGCVDARRT